MSAALPLLTEVGLVLEGVDRRWWGWAAAWCPISQRVFAVLDNALVSMSATGADQRVVYELGGDPDDRPTDSRVMVDGTFALLWAAETSDWVVVDLAQGRPVPTRVRGAVDGAWLNDGVLYTTATVDDRRAASALDLRTRRERWSVQWSGAGPDAWRGQGSEGWVTDSYLVVNESDGESAMVIELATTRTRATFAVLSVSGSHALVRTPRGAIALFSLEEHAIVALLEGAERSNERRFSSWGADRFVTAEASEVLVLDARSRSLIAGARTEDGAAMLGEGLLMGDRWLVEKRALDVRALDGEPSVRVNVAVPSATQPSKVRLGRALEVPSKREDVERLRVIVAILDEEESNLSAARDRLQARGVIPDGFDPRLRMQSSDGELSSFRWTDRSRRAWISAAYDAPAIIECEALAREALERWRPWWRSEGLPSLRWWTGAKAPRVSHVDGPWALLREALFIAQQRGDDEGARALRYHEWVERAAVWREAAERALVIPGDDRLFGAVPSPYEPLVAMAQCGALPLAFDGESLLVGRALIEDEATARREACAWRQ